MVLQNNYYKAMCGFQCRAPCIVFYSEFLLWCKVPGYFTLYSGLLLPILHQNSSRLFLSLMQSLLFFCFFSDVFPRRVAWLTVSLKNFKRFVILYMAILPIKGQRASSGWVNFSLLRYNPLLIINIQSCTFYSLWTCPADQTNIVFF